MMVAVVSLVLRAEDYPVVGGSIQPAGVSARKRSAYCGFETAMEAMPHHRGEAPRETVEESPHRQVVETADVQDTNCRARDIVVAYLENQILAAAASAVGADEGKMPAAVGSPAARTLGGMQDMSRYWPVNRAAKLVVDIEGSPRTASSRRY